MSDEQSPKKYVLRLKPSPTRRASGSSNAWASPRPDNAGGNGGKSASRSNSLNNLRLNIPTSSNPDASPLKVTFKDPDIESETSTTDHTPLGSSEDERKRSPMRLEQAKLAAAITKFYNKHCPRKAFQAKDIAKVYGGKMNGVPELFAKLRNLYGDVPDYSPGYNSTPEATSAESALDEDDTDRGAQEPFPGADAVVEEFAEDDFDTDSDPSPQHRSPTRQSQNLPRTRSARSTDASSPGNMGKGLLGNWKPLGAGAVGAGSGARSPTAAGRERALSPGQLGTQLFQSLEKNVSPNPRGISWETLLGSSSVTGTGFRAPLGFTRVPARPLRSPRNSLTVTAEDANPSRKSPRRSLTGAATARRSPSKGAMKSPRPSMEGGAMNNAALTAAAVAAAAAMGATDGTTSRPGPGRRSPRVSLSGMVTGRSPQAESKSPRSPRTSLTGAVTGGSERGSSEGVDEEQLSPQKRSLRARALQVRAKLMESGWKEKE